MKFNIGDRVQIVGTGLERYRLDFARMWYGTVQYVSSTDVWTNPIRVTVDGFENPESKSGFCYFKEYELKPMGTIKNVTIINVIFNDPATIVFWYDGTKTVVKAQGDDIFDPEKGLAMAIAKKFMGNKGNYCNELKKWLPKEEKTEEDFDLYEFKDMLRKKIADALTKPPFDDSSNKSYSPVQKAYDILVKARDGKNENAIDYDEIIGYLGEALNG